MTKDRDSSQTDQKPKDQLRSELGLKALDESQALSALTEQEALDLAYSELDAMRRERERGA